MDIITNQALISINETALVQLISFLIFLLIFKRLMFNPLRKSVAERAAHIEKTRQAIVAADQEVARLLSRLEEQKFDVREEAFRINKELEQEAAKQAEKILTTTRQEITKLKTDAGKEIDAQIIRARKHVEKESENLVSNIIEQILKRRRVA